MAYLLTSSAPSPHYQLHPLAIVLIESSKEEHLVGGGWLGLGFPPVVGWAASGFGFGFGRLLFVEVVVIAGVEGALRPCLEYQKTAAQMKLIR